MRFLLSNDDSHSSPLLQVLIDFLSTQGDLTVVVPKHEQSWKGKSMSRFDTLHLEEIELGGKPAYSLDGTPADCINVGIYHLSPHGKPDVVVSGINAGLNAGISFILSSGTVGACLEANIAGIPAIALSQMFDSETMNRYSAEYALPDGVAERLHEQYDRLLPRIFGCFGDNQKLLGDAITWNINFPFNDRADTTLKVSSLGATYYGSCYRRENSHFVHELHDVRRDSDPSTDIQTLLAGHVSVTPLDLRVFGQVSPRETVGLQSHFAG